MPPDRSAEHDRIDIGQTLRAARTRPHGRTERFEDSVAPSELAEATARRPRLRLGAVLGEGGMGTVHSATQPGLDREVAVKTLRPDGGRPSSLERFLQEARVGGLVEHPNVIPVYDLLVTEEGTPALVMKRVAGDAWAEHLQRPERISGDDGADPLGWHLRVLMALCDAVQYAHDIGIVHRDIKPDNVMIGRFGEVYLLDWGLAVSTREEHAGFIALAREARGVAGTPAYMAPEMAAGDTASLGPATDVYLLGATLHEVVAGQPPHTGDNLYMVALQAFESEPHEYPPRVPSELAAICHRAMAREPSARFESAARLREAVEAFLTHRESHELAETGRRALDRLDQKIEEAPDVDAPIEDLFGAVRFSLGQAIQLWPGNDGARADWQRALGRMARYELSRGRPAAAAALAAELSAPDEALSLELQRLKSERARRDEEVSQLRRLQREHDLTVSKLTRSRLAVALAVIWLVLTLGTARLEAAGVIEIDRPLFLAGGTLLILMVVALGFVGRGLLANAVNRRIYVAVVGGSAAAIFGRLVAVIHQQSVPITFAREQLIYALIAAVIAIISDLRILAGAAALLLTAAASAAWPGHAFELGGVGVFVALSCMAYVWRRSR